MLGIFKKHPNIIWIITIVIVAVSLLGVWQRRQYMKNPYENQIGNPPRENNSVEDTFYYDQLNDNEKEAYDTIKNAIENFEGGDIEFKTPLNGKEYARVSQALECGQEDYFYAIVDVPMNKNNQNVSYTTKNVLDIKEDVIVKCMVFLYPAEGIDIQGNIDDEGYVKNLEELRQPLNTMNEDKKNKVLSMQNEIDEILDDVVNKMPKEYGKKEAIDYFLDWIDKNLKIDEELMQTTANITSMSHAFEEVYFKSHCSCVTTDKAMASGYTKVLNRLCNKAGIPAYTVIGKWGMGQAYTMTYVDFAGKPVYIDASGYKKGDLWNQRYISDTLLMRKMDIINYFEYGMKKD